MTLTGRGTHKQYHVGMPLKVTLTNANVEQHQLDFEIYDPNAPKRSHNNRGTKNERRGNRGFRNDHAHKGHYRNNFQKNGNHPHISKYNH